MSEFLLYLLEASLGLALVYGLFRIFLGGLTFHQGNRIALVAGLIACFLIPLGHFEVSWMPDWQESAVGNVWKNDLFLLPFADAGASIPATASESLAPVPTSIPKVTPSSEGPASAISLWQILFVLWFFGFLFHFLRLTGSLLLLHRMARRGPSSRQGGIRIVDLPGQGQPFSIFRAIFLYENHRDHNREMILEHEAAHIRQGHSLDRLLFQIAGALLWFHPVMPHYKNLLIDSHEYLADQAVVSQSGALPYARLLFGMALHKAQPGPVNHFAYSSTRKRISMINKSPSPSKTRYRYFLLLPMLAAMVLLFACAKSPEDLSIPSGDSILSQIDTDKVTFAGEAVPLDQPKVREALESAMQKIKEKPKRFEQLLGKQARWRPSLEGYLESGQVHSDFFYLAVAESELTRQAVSSSGALGMWQFMPATARNQGLEVDSGKDERLDVQLSTKAAAKLLTELRDKFGSWTVATSAYNRGPGAVRKDKEAGKFSQPADLYLLPEAQHYLIRIVAFKLALENPQVIGIPAEFKATFEEKAPDGDPLSNTVFRVTSTFGQHKNRPFHKGVDLAAPIGTPVYATGSGTVVVSKEEGKYGKYILIQHGADYETLFAHLSKLHVEAGTKVEQGQLIGEIGNTGVSTGPHLHYEVRRRGTPINPDDC